MRADDGPAWWKESLPSSEPSYPDGYPPVWNETRESNNKGAANLGQAKWVAKNALAAIGTFNPVLASSIEDDLVGVGKPIPNWNAPVNQAERDKNHAPLLLGQLKAIALPFYNHLNLAAPDWVLEQIQENHAGDAVLNTHYWQISGDSNYSEDGYFAWNPATPSAVNHQPATIGQLKALFSLRFETVPLAAFAYGRTGGAAEMNLWAPTGLYDNESKSSTDDYHNARDPGTNVNYTFNPDLWCKKLLPQLTCVVVAKDDCGTNFLPAGECWRARYGGVAITKRHVLYCAHAYTHAQGTWAINGNTTNSPPTRLRFIDKNGNTVDRIQLHQASAGDAFSNAANDSGAHPADLCVAVLDQDLPDTVFIPKIIPSLSSLAVDGAFDEIGVSQEWQPGAYQSPTSPEESEYYPRHNRQMIYLHRMKTGHGPFPPFEYNQWGGDSGTPSFTLAKGNLVLSIINGAENLAGTRHGWTAEDRLNTLIGLADQYAINLGRMSVPTGYTVTIAADSDFDQ